MPRFTKDGYEKIISSVKSVEYQRGFNEGQKLAEIKVKLQMEKEAARLKFASQIGQMIQANANALEAVAHIYNDDSQLFSTNPK